MRLSCRLAMLERWVLFVLVRFGDRELTFFPARPPRQTVPCTTYLVQPGFFDIFFPTDFHTMAEMYSLVMASDRGVGDDHVGYFSSRSPLRGSTGTDSADASAGGRRRALEVIDHADFLEEWAEIDMTRTQDGTNPMVDSYQNAKFIC